MAGISLRKSLELMLLRSAVTDADLEAACEAAAAAHLACVSVFPVHVRRATRILRGSDTRVGVAISTPFGHESTAAKLVALDQARSDGASELAVALDHHALMSGAIDRVRAELDQLGAGIARSSLNIGRGGDLTVMVESLHYDSATLNELGRELEGRSVEFVQTSSGFQSRAVTENHIRELRELLPGDISIKAVGGVGSLDDALCLVNAGAVRVGSQSAVSIADDELGRRAVRQGGTASG